MIGQDLRGVVEAGDGVATLQPVEEVPAQRRQRGRSAGGDARGFVLVIGEPVQDQVLLGREVPEERRLGDLGGGHLRDGHGVEPLLQEESDRDVGDSLVHPLLLALAQSDLTHAPSLRTPRHLLDLPTFPALLALLGPP